MHVFSGSKLRALRTARGVSREQLAVTTGKSHASIVSYELGRAVPGADTVASLADGIPCDPGDLFDVVPDSKAA